VSFAAIILRVASQRVLIVVADFVTDSVRNFWIHPRIISVDDTAAYNNIINKCSCRTSLTVSELTAYGAFIPRVYI
jgi:hypothetical protein